MLTGSTVNDFAWSSTGLPPGEALRHWQGLASAGLASMHIDVPDGARFAASWRSRAVGQLRLVELQATPQRVTHGGASGAEATFQLVYCTGAPMHTRLGQRQFSVGAGEFVLVDNAQPYEVWMDTLHRAIDVVIPRSWLERWLPDPLQCAGRPFSASNRWGLPLGSLLAAMTEELENAALPYGTLADQVGALLALAVGPQDPGTGNRKRRLAGRIRRLIEERYRETGLAPVHVADALGISRRYLHAVLAETGSTFLGTLNRIRLERARDLLDDPRFARQRIAEVAWQCGFADPSYFARAFRKRFGKPPRRWRDGNTH